MKSWKENILSIIYFIMIVIILITLAIYIFSDKFQAMSMYNKVTVIISFLPILIESIFLKTTKNKYKKKHKNINILIEENESIIQNLKVFYIHKSEINTSKEDILNQLKGTEEFKSACDMKSKLIKYNHETYTEKYLESQIRMRLTTSILLITFIILCLKLENINDNFVAKPMILLSCIYIFLLMLQGIVESYRVKRGLFGTCFSEAKKLIIYINKEKKNNDNSRGTKIFTDEKDYVENEILGVVLGGAY